MAKPEKNKKSHSLHPMLIVTIICAVCSAVLSVITEGSRDAIIIENGIRFWTSLHNLSLAAWGVTAVLAVITVILMVMRSRKSARDTKAEMEREQEQEEKSRQSSAYLDPNSLDPEVIAAIVRDQIRHFRGLNRGTGPDPWQDITKSYLKLSEQMSEMDRYQEKLKHLLTSNGADSLSDMNDMLDKIEQHLLRQIRKVLNVQDLFSDSSPSDMKQLSRILNDTVALNETHLSQVREFLFAVAEFLNNQDSGDSDLRMLESYRQTILDTMREQEDAPISSYLQGSARQEAKRREEEEIRLTL